MLMDFVTLFYIQVHTSSCIQMLVTLFVMCQILIFALHDARRHSN